jgi:hypothetical protein
MNTFKSIKLACLHVLCLYFVIRHAMHAFRYTQLLNDIRFKLFSILFMPLAKEFEFDKSYMFHFKNQTI